jgi:hypothetical protein
MVKSKASRKEAKAKARKRKIDAEAVYVKRAKLIGMMNFWKSLINGQAQRRIAELKMKIAVLQEDIEWWEDHEARAEKGYQSCVSQLKKIGQEEKLHKLQPKIDKAKKLVAQLRSLEKDAANGKLNEEEIAMLRQAMKSANLNFLNPDDDQVDPSTEQR